MPLSKHPLVAAGPSDSRSDGMSTINAVRFPLREYEMRIPFEHRW